MKSLMPSPADNQILAILDESDADLVQVCPALAHGQKPEDFTFDRVFHVSPSDVVAYVKSHGWNPKFVCEAPAIPRGDSNRVGTIFIVPALDGGGYQVALLEERGHVEVWAVHPDLSSAREYVAKILIRRQWASWNMRFLRKRPELRSPGQKLTEIFKLPPGMTGDDFID